MGKRVLICGPNWLGDAVMAVPAVEALRAAEPGWRIAMFTRKGLAGLWAMEGAVDEVVEAPESGAGWGETRAAGRRLREMGFGRAYAMANSVRSALYPWLAGIPERVGAAGHFPRRWLLTEVVDTAGARGEEEHQGAEAFRLFFPGRAVPNPLPGAQLRAPEGAEAAARVRLAEMGLGEGKVVAMLPGAARGTSKQWPEERYAETGAVLARETGAGTLLLGSKGEAALCGRIAEAIRAKGGWAGSLAGTTDLAGLAGALSAADAVLGNDSGGMHLAAALGRPAVVCFGITNPAQTGPMGERVTVLQHSERRTRDVPRESAEAEAALRAISAREAADAVERWLDGRG